MASISIMPPSPRFSGIPKLVLLDRDEVINEDVGAPGVIRINDFRLTPHAGSAIGNLKRAGCVVVVVTNQSSVGKGLIDDKQLWEIHAHMQSLLLDQDGDARLDRIYACTSTKEQQNDPNMKPNPGMILEACRDFDVSSKDCVFVGDTVTDLQASASAEISFKILVSTGYGRSVMERDVKGGIEELIDTANDKSTIPSFVLPFHYVRNLESAVSFLLSNNSESTSSSL